MSELTDKLTILGGRLRDVVLPSLGTRAARGHAGVAVGGDVTFSIDKVSAAGNQELQAALVESVQRGIAGLRRPEA